MKIRNYGALTSAFLITLATGAAADSSYCPPKIVRHASARPAPARVVRRNADAEAYAQSFYNYDTASTVSEIVAQRLEASLPPEQPWQQAPDDARIRFHPYDVGMAAPQGQPIALNDNEQFEGGVGYTMGAHPGDGGGYGGQVHLYDGSVGQNGPTYNDYNNSFSTGGFSEGSHGTNPSPIYSGITPTGPRRGY